MSSIDWIVLCGTLGLIMAYGIYRSRGQRSLDSFLLGERSLPWYYVMFSVMATQASAITFLSAPGQAYTDGMRFVQFYFGLPLAIIFICAFFLPRFLSFKVFTAYEYLEQRFDLKTRMLTALLFLVQRGLSAGLTIYAPSIVLSVLLGWNIYWTNVFMGGLVIIYTVAGGSKAVSFTQLQQMIVILSGMFIAAVLIVMKLPPGVGVTDALEISGTLGKLNAITFTVDLNDKFNLLSGVIGGFFLALSYFGTDQSQVGRYLSGKSLTQSRVGLLMNAMVKIPMQFAILLIGALLVGFYHFHPAPVNFNPSFQHKIASDNQEWKTITEENSKLQAHKKEHAEALLFALDKDDKEGVMQEKQALTQVNRQEKDLRQQAGKIIKAADKSADTNDTNYIFLNFVITYLPAGLIGLLIACIFSASWNSTSSELNALASTFIIDFYKRSVRPDASDKHYVAASRWATIGWGIFAICVAMVANQLGSLIEAVNTLGSLFYGTVLGIFLTAFFLKRVRGREVFIAALISETIVILCFYADIMAFLWLNLLGSVLVMLLSTLLSLGRSK